MDNVFSSILKDISRTDAISMARVCEQTEMFDDMTKYLKKGVKEDPILLQEEREMLELAYKNVLNPKRMALNKLTKLEKRLEANNSKRLPIVREYKSKIEATITQYCNEILDLLESSIIPSSERVPLVHAFY